MRHICSNFTTSLTKERQRQPSTLVLVQFGSQILPYEATTKASQPLSSTQLVPPQNVRTQHKLSSQHHKSRYFSISVHYACSSCLWTVRYLRSWLRFRRPHKRGSTKPLASDGRLRALHTPERGPNEATVSETVVFPVVHVGAELVRQGIKGRRYTPRRGAKGGGSEGHGTRSQERTGRRKAQRASSLHSAELDGDTVVHVLCLPFSRFTAGWVGRGCGYHVNGSTAGPFFLW